MEQQQSRNMQMGVFCVTGGGAGTFCGAPPSEGASPRSYCLTGRALIVELWAVGRGAAELIISTGEDGGLGPGAACHPQII